MGISVITINTQRSIILDGLGNKKCIPYSTYKYKKSRYTLLWEKGLQVICQTGRSSKDASVEMSGQNLYVHDSKYTNNTHLFASCRDGHNA